MYITVQEVKDHFGKLITDVYFSSTLSAVDDNQIQTDIIRAESFINGFVKKAYKNGVTSPESFTILQQFTLNFLAYIIYSKLYDYANIPANIVDLRNSTEFRLKDLANGLFLLPDEPQDPKSSVISYDREGSKNRGLPRESLRRLM